MRLMDRHGMRHTNGEGFWPPPLPIPSSYGWSVAASCE
jgi:hypothetical protein